MGKTAKFIFCSDWDPIRAFAPLMKDTQDAVCGDLLPALRAAVTVPDPALFDISISQSSEMERPNP